MNKSDILFFCNYIQHFLNGSDNYGASFCLAQIYFHNKFHPGLVFSTRFGGDFFEETKRRVESGEEIKGEKDRNGKEIPLGEYDISFNRWLKNLS
jgi:hypothetical protein